MPWAIYAMLVVCGYMFDLTGNSWYFAPIGGMAIVMTHLFFQTYNALVHMYNDQRIRNAIMAEYKPQEKQACKAQAQAAGTVHAGSKVLGSEPTEVDKGVVSSEASTIRRYSEALDWINTYAVNIGQARDRAWRAMEHDNIESNKKDWTNAKEAEETKDK
jgi:hypothetical protein